MVADNFWRAKEAAAALEIKIDTKGNEALSMASLYAAHDVALAGETTEKDLEIGDANAAIGKAAKTMQATYRVPFLAHACMEPMNCTVWIRGGKADVWVGSQDALGTRARVAEVSGIDFDNVKMHPLLLGGDFDAILPTDGIKKALQGIGRNVYTVDMDITGNDSKAIRATLNDVGMTPVDATFPDIGHVVPREVSGAVAQFNPAYIGDIGKAAKILGQKMRIGHNGYGPALVTFGNMCNAFAVLMPMTSPSAHDLSPSHIRYTLGEFREGEVKLAA